MLCAPLSCDRLVPFTLRDSKLCLFSLDVQNGACSREETQEEGTYLMMDRKVQLAAHLEDPRSFHPQSFEPPSWFFLFVMESSVLQV